MQEGTLYWITGLSGAGKTTIGKKVYEMLRRVKDNVVFLDGDSLREAFGDDLGYTREDRRKSANRNAKISRMLTAQGIDVICCTISMFDDVRAWNREQNENYLEVYLKVPTEILMLRNQKNLYSTDKASVAGFGVAVEEPKNADIVVINDASLSPEQIASLILQRVGHDV